MLYVFLGYNYSVCRVVAEEGVLKRVLFEVFLEHFSWTAVSCVYLFSIFVWSLKKMLKWSTMRGVDIGACLWRHCVVYKPLKTLCCCSFMVQWRSCLCKALWMRFGCLGCPKLPLMDFCNKMWAPWFINFWRHCVFVHLWCVGRVVFARHCRCVLDVLVVYDVWMSLDAFWMSWFVVFGMYLILAGSLVE